MSHQDRTRGSLTPNGTESSFYKITSTSFVNEAKETQRIGCWPSEVPSAVVKLTSVQVHWEKAAELKFTAMEFATIKGISVREIIT
jgi:hypothetical protein